MQLYPSVKYLNVKHSLTIITNNSVISAICALNITSIIKNKLAENTLSKTAKACQISEVNNLIIIYFL